MRFKIASVLAASAAFVPFLAQADGLSYSYVDVAYVNTDLDETSEDVDGLALRGSLEITEQVFLFAGYSDQSGSIGGRDLDFETYSLGVGYAWPIAPRMDLYGKIGYTEADADFRGFGGDDDGYLLAFGLRSRVQEQLELEGSLNYVDLSDSGDDTSLGLSARWYFTEQFAAGVEGAFGDDANTYGIGVRWHFGG
jgi:hypothetical protein